MARIRFDFGASHSFASELAHAGIIRPLVVSDAGTAANGLLDRALEALPAGMSGSPRYLEVPSNPDIACVEAGIKLYRAAGCAGAMAVGGGRSNCMVWPPPQTPLGLLLATSLVGQIKAFSPAHLEYSCGTAHCAGGHTDKESLIPSRVIGCTLS
jgi:hypothetical protein